MTGGDLAAALDGLRADWGLDYARVRPVVARLAAGAAPATTELVEQTGLPRRNVEEIVRAVGPWAGTAALARAVEAPPPLPGAGGLAARMADLAAGLPASLWRLDHVPATPETMAARALHLAGAYELAGASVLCLGDHDLTSLAVGLVAPDADISVVDVDELILDHIRLASRAAGAPVTTAAADLRLGLPASLAGRADLVFTDPPYTPEGIRLFLVRAVEALRKGDHARIAFCYGTGERHLTKAVEVQAVLGELRLAVEAVLPGFNRYHGAEAIGSRSSLYVCRPTPKTWTRRLQPPADARIYTRGLGALESRPPAAPPPGPLPAATTDVPTFATRTAAWATAATSAPPPYGGEITLYLGPHYGASLTRLLLLAGAGRVTFVVPGRDLAASGWLDPDDPVHRLLTAAYDLAVERPATGSDPAVVTAARHGRPPDDPGRAVLAHLVTHPGAKVVNAWRDALIAWSRARGAPITRNEARARIDAGRLDPSLRRLRPYELPRAVLSELVVVAGG